MAWYCIVFDIIAVYCMSPHCILWYGMVLYFIWSYCTVSHCYVPLLQRAGELPRSASSHFVCICIRTPLNRKPVSQLAADFSDIAVYKENPIHSKWEKGGSQITVNFPYIVILEGKIFRERKYR